MLSSLPVSHIAGVGRAKQNLLQELGLTTVYDVLHHFPFRFEDRRVQPLEAFPDSSRVTVRATVEGDAIVRWQGKKSVLSAQIFVDRRHRLTAIWFNQPYLKQKLVDGRLLVINGKYDVSKRTIVVSGTEFEAGSTQHVNDAFYPIYRSVKGLSSAQLQTIIEHALHQFGQQIEEVLPQGIVQKYRLFSHREAVFAMHQPKDSEMLHQAHRRLAFEEFFVFQLQLQWFRRTSAGIVTRPAKLLSPSLITTFERSLPAHLTGAQRAACQQLVSDFSSEKPMHRLLQGDVGSGKTWVALFAVFAVVTAHQQAALMAPTEILAEQHNAEARRRLEGLGVSCALLTGRTTSKERQQILDGIRNGEIDLLIGTHALLTSEIEFAKLGLVITDEQHRFGVSQRSILRGKGTLPDVLLLSATPIPRTLALAVYGDLDVTTLHERPKGRRPILTTHVSMRQENSVIRKIRQEVAKGHQAYVVAPLVAQSDELNMVSAKELYEQFQEQFAGHCVGLLHGKQSAKEKEATMRSFVCGDVDVLVSTTVIEVGIDVPNATVMCIYHADRFGLAQLHQLRGRVGRGSAQSFCILLADPTNDIAKERLQCMLQTEDGFEIAERDLELRGPGEFLGVRQSGLPAFSVGDLTKDFKIMAVAREEALSLMGTSDFWLLPKFQPLLRTIANVFEDKFYKD